MIEDNFLHETFNALANVASVQKPTSNISDAEKEEELADESVKPFSNNDIRSAKRVLAIHQIVDAFRNEKTGVTKEALKQCSWFADYYTIEHVVQITPIDEYWETSAVGKEVFAFDKESISETMDIARKEAWHDWKTILTVFNLPGAGDAIEAINLNFENPTVLVRVTLMVGDESSSRKRLYFNFGGLVVVKTNLNGNDVVVLSKPRKDQ